MSIDQGRLISLLQQESASLDELYAVLMKEFSALKVRNLDSITMFSEEKAALLDKLEKLDKERQLCLQEENQVNNQIYSDEINHLNNKVETSLNKCKNQNNINGGIIEMSKLFNEKMLDIISGNSHQETTYGATGKSNSDKNRHSLGRA